MRKPFAILTALAGLTTASPAFAQWDHEWSDEVCAFNTVFEAPNDGATLFAIRQTREAWELDRITIAFLNDDWSIADGEDLPEIKVIGDDGAWLSNEPLAIPNGFILWTTREHIENITSSSGIAVERDGREIMALSLSGFYIVWLGFTECVRKWERAKAEAERQAAIEARPVDPFAD